MTVIRQPLKSRVATGLVREHMAQLSPTALIILKRLRVLELAGCASATRAISRESTKEARVAMTRKMYCPLRSKRPGSFHIEK